MVARKQIKNEIPSRQDQTSGPRHASDQQATVRIGGGSESQNGGNHTHNQAPASQSGKLLQCLAVISALAAMASAISSIWSNHITSQSVGNAREHAQFELRPYVSVTGKVTNISSGGPVNVRLTIRNAGRTPANNLLVHFHVMGGENQPMESYKRPFPCPGCCGGDVRFTQADIPTNLPAEGITIVDHPLPSSVRNDLLNGKHPIRALGCITYSDVFNQELHESFSLIQGGQYDPHADAMGQDYDEPDQSHSDN
jgi:hypothetical protein